MRKGGFQHQKEGEAYKGAFPGSENSGSSRTTLKLGGTLSHRDTTRPPEVCQVPGSIHMLSKTPEEKHAQGTAPHPILYWQ